MLTKLIRPLLENGWNTTKFVSTQSLSTSNILFQKTPSTTNTKNQQQKQQQDGNKNKSRAESDVEQGRSQQEGPADKEAERKSSKANDKTTKSKK
ncbi:unnamed protein product [Adineta steineri]|uniref:Uncharacterized protein n=1 Tax=Adineta steineri TaxID=433720 RepID=A0A815Q106_9BILA|nr:unnamed protein product [Adineta steineri]